jgi:hypothetical protein
MVSPGNSPAMAAGVAASLAVHSVCWVAPAAAAGMMHWLTLDTVVVWVGTPMPTISTPKMPTARIRFINGPAAMITIRLGGSNW